MRRLKEERKRQRLSQTRLSALTGIAQSDLSAIETGRRVPGPGWRRRIAEALNVSESELFGDCSRTRGERATA